MTTVDGGTRVGRRESGRWRRLRRPAVTWLLIAWLVPGVVAGARAEVPGARAALLAGECAKAGETINDGLSRNDAEAYFLAGFLYDQGQCVERDANRAVRLYRQAVAYGSPEAEVFLGLLLGQGRGVSQDYAAAHRAFHGDKPVAGEEALGAAELAAIGYAETLAKLALRHVDYPMTANRSGVEADLDVVLVPDGGRIELANVKVGIETGTNLPRTRDFTERVESAYRDAMAQASPPQGGDAALRVVTAWHFAMRRTPDNRKVRLEGYVSVGDPHTSH